MSALVEVPTRDEEKEYRKKTNDAVSTSGKVSFFSVSLSLSLSLSLVVRLRDNRLLNLASRATSPTFSTPPLTLKRPLLSLSLSLHRNHASNPGRAFLKVENGRMALLRLAVEAAIRFTIQRSARMVTESSSSLSVWTGFFDIF